MLLTSTLSLTYHRNQTFGLIANNIRITNLLGVTSAKRLLIKNALRTLTAVFVDTHGLRTIRKSGIRERLPAGAKLTRRHFRLKNSIGVTSAGTSLIKTVARTPTVVSADGVGPIMTAKGTDQRTLSAAAKSKSDSSKIMNLSGETIAKT